MIGEIGLIVPDLVLEELIRVLALKLKWGQDELNVVDAEIRALAIDVPPAPSSAPPVTGDPADDRILAAALASSAEILVSGDRRHLLPVGVHEHLRILRPQDFLAELRAG